MNQLQRLEPAFQSGLSQEDVLNQQKLGLKNTSPEKITKSNSQIVKDNILTLFNFYNFAIAVCLFLVGAYSNMLFILIIITNIVIGIAQEIHAKNLVEELSLVNLPKATVVRAGRRQEIAVEEIVLDDIIVYESGQQIITDSIVQNGQLEVNESLLTGEADSIKKKVGDLLLSGSFVVSGKCFAKVEHVGLDNYATKIAHEAKQHKAVNSELLRSMRKVTNFTSFLIIPLGLILFVQAFFWREDSLQISVVATAAGLLGMLPKGLVLLISIALASGVIVLAKKRVLVQELFALETLAHVDMLCLDKTGTITEGKMSVQEVYELSLTEAPPDFTQVMSAFVHNADDNNATYLALKEYFTAASDLKPLDKIPFSSQRKWSGMRFQEGFTLLLGAPDRLCKEPLPAEICAAEKKGSRVLLAAYTQALVEEENCLPELTPWAYLVINDPVRENAPQTLAYFKEQGVEIKIISGDNPVTVSAVSQEAGLEKYASYIDMSEINKEEDIEKAVRDYTVFGRVSPYQKKQIIQALKKQGHTVAMTGDGVNDVLALREADCSIALAEGSDAARQVSKLVLLNSDFASLLDVLSEGRRVVNNITRIASIFFVKTIYSVFLTVLCIFLNVIFPFIPLQTALLDIVIEGFPSFTMSFEKNNKKVTESFLHTVLRRATPNALTIMFAMIIVHFASPYFLLDEKDRISIMYMLIGFVSILAMIRACMPFNKFRVFICATTIVGFFGLIFLFHDLLKINLLQGDALQLFIGIAAFSWVSEHTLAILFNKVMLGKAAYKV